MEEKDEIIISLSDVWNIIKKNAAFIIIVTLICAIGSFFITTGTEVASYVYDAWGNIKDTKGDPTVRELNPIRYRGYVYDTETDLYY